MRKMELAVLSLLVLTGLGTVTASAAQPSSANYPKVTFEGKVSLQSQTLVAESSPSGRLHAEIHRERTFHWIRVLCDEPPLKLSLRYKVIYKRNDGALAESPTEEWPTAAPADEGQGSLFIRAVRIWLVGEDAARYDLSYEGTLSFGGSTFQEGLPRVRDGQLLGREIGQGSGDERLTRLDIYLQRR